MIIYYTEYPKGQFKAKNDSEALQKSRAQVIYKESEDGKKMVIVRDKWGQELDTE